MDDQLYTIESITQQFREGIDHPPTELSQIQKWLSGEYSFKMSQLQVFLRDKSEKWMELRKTCSSDTQATHKWAMTKEGIYEMQLRMELKRLEKLMSGSRARLDIQKVEMRNIV